jgi:NAD-dependent oxidoreductase involved in siderophore biosynthesis
MDEDLKARRIGYFRSNHDRLKEFQDGSPDYIWVFRTPRGLKGQVRLHARLLWSDSAVVPMAKRSGNEAHMYYDPASADSVTYTNGETTAAVAAATAWVRNHFPDAIKANFQGVNGQHPLRGAAVVDLRLLASALTRVPFAQA